MARFNMANTLLLVATVGIVFFYGVKHAQNHGPVVENMKRSNDLEDLGQHNQDVNQIRRHLDDLHVKGQGHSLDTRRILLDTNIRDPSGDAANVIDADLRFMGLHKVKVHQKERNEGQGSRLSILTLDAQSDPYDGQFKFAAYFSDNMVLQREPHKVLVWGYAPLSTVGQKIGVEVSNKLKEYVTMVQKDGNRGRWEVRIDPYNSNGPHDISASLGSHVIWLRGVLFGEVWLCAGSDVMATPSQSKDFVGSDWENSDIRTYIIPTVMSKHPLDDVSARAGQWTIPNKYSLSHFSAACWAYGLRLQQRLGRPVGLIQATAPDSKIASWLPPGAGDACFNDPSSKDDILERYTVFNGMIQPYLKMSIHGIIWYHGESDNTAPSLYGCYLQSMVSTWERVWDTGMQGYALQPLITRIPWGIVQLGAAEDSRGTEAGDIRWAQTAGTGYLPNKFMPKAFLALTVDITKTALNHSVILDAGTLSKRLLAGSLDLVYPTVDGNPAKNVEEGPRPSSVKVTDDTITIVYGLNLEEQSLDVRSISGFEVCCTLDSKDLKCNWHASEITSHSVTSVALRNPCSVRHRTSELRYLWGASPCGTMDCPIYSKDSSIPAPPWKWTLPKTTS